MFFDAPDDVQDEVILFHMRYAKTVDYRNLVPRRNKFFYNCMLQYYSHEGFNTTFHVGSLAIHDLGTDEMIYIRGGADFTTLEHFFRFNDS